jgi:hypothetical protein
MLLQRKYAKRLVHLGLISTPLLDVFGQYLDLLLTDDVDALLSHVAQRQAQMSGRSLNWRGTYENALQRLVRRMELEVAWAEN